MMGKRNPIPEFVVAPSMVIASPMFGMAKESMKLIKTRIKVVTIFYFWFNFLGGALGSSFFLRKSSSTVSLQGKIVTGVAKRITTRIPNNET